MKNQNFGILIAVVAAFSLAAGARGSSDQSPKALRQFSDGTVVVAGSMVTAATASPNAFFSQRFDRTGRRMTNVSGRLPVAAQFLAIGKDGGTVVLASSANCGLWVNKYDPSGRQAWLSAATYRGAGNGADVPVSVSIDGAGDVVVLAMTRLASERANYATWKIDGTTGSTRWGPRLYDGPGLRNSVPNSLAFGPSGNVIVTGFTFNGTDNDGVTLMYDGVTGDRVGAEMVLALPGHDDRSKLIAVGNGTITVASCTVGDGVTAFATARYDLTTGAPIGGPVTISATGRGAPTAIAVDDSDNVFVTGFGLDANGYSFQTVKYDGASGALLWGPVLTGTNGYSLAMTVAGGNPIVTGFTTNSSGNADFATYCFDGRTGASRWASTFNGAANGDDVPVALAADGRGGFWIAGRSYTRSGTQSVTMRCDSVTGK